MEISSPLFVLEPVFDPDSIYIHRKKCYWVLTMASLWLRRNVRFTVYFDYLTAMARHDFAGLSIRTFLDPLFLLSYGLEQSIMRGIIDNGELTFSWKILKEMWTILHSASSGIGALCSLSFTVSAQNFRNMKPKKSSRNCSPFQEQPFLKMSTDNYWSSVLGKPFHSNLVYFY